MATTVKKPAVKKEVNKVETKKTPAKTSTAKTKKESQKEVKKMVEQFNVLSELSKIGDAYTAAINGKIKFSKVKEMFKKLHKQVKESSKK